MNACIVCTTRCNLRCPDCLARKATTADDMAIAQIHRIAEGPWKFQQVAITGGEPTLWRPLREAVSVLKQSGTVGRVKIISNGYKAPAGLYGNADIIQLSHYGAINVNDILRLRRDLGKRVRVNNVRHRRIEPANTVSCTARHLTFFGFRVYPCSAAWRLAPDSGRPIGAPLAEINPAWCRTCEHNRDAIAARKTIIEIRVLDSVLYWTITLPRMAGLRSRYRRWLEQGVELYNGEPG